MTACIYVGMGGFIGSILRYLIGLIPLKTTHGFPLLTLFINILGAFLIGFISTIALKKSMNPHLVLLLKTGLLSIVLGLSAIILGDYCAH